MSDSVRPHRRQPTRLPRPWDSPGKNTGVGCHFLLQCWKVKSESEVAQSCLTLSDPMDSSLPGSSAMGFSRQKYWSGLRCVLFYIWGNWVSKRLKACPRSQSSKKLRQDSILDLIPTHVFFPLWHPHLLWTSNSSHLVIGLWPYYRNVHNEISWRSQQTNIKTPSNIPRTLTWSPQPCLE